MFRNTVQVSAPSQAGDDRLSGVDRVLATMKEVAKHPRGVRLEDLSRTLASPKSSIHRALVALRKVGFVDHDERGLYHLGLEFLRVAFDHYAGLDERALVDPVLRALANHFGETAHFAKLHDAEVVYVAIVAPVAGIKLTSVIGGRNPAHCTAVGKALLAHALLNRTAVADYVKRHGPLAKRTPTTVTTVTELHRELELIRARGYAVDREESEAGVNCVAMAVFTGPQVQPSGAISVSGLTHRTPLAKLVRGAAEFRALILKHLGIGSVGVVAA